MFFFGKLGQHLSFVWANFWECSLFLHTLCFVVDPLPEFKKKYIYIYIYTLGPGPHPLGRAVFRKRLARQVAT